MMYRVTLILIMLARTSAEQTISPEDRAKIAIINTGPPIAYQPTFVEAGPSVGAMLNNHYFPGIKFYNAGRYLNAEAELGYVVGRPQYLEGNPRRNEFMSTSHYLLGMIYMYHADGLGRRILAKEQFEQAIDWNPNNYMAYMELARVFGELRFTKQATELIQRLLDLKPPEDVATQARHELEKFSGAKK